MAFAQARPVAAGAAAGAGGSAKAMDWAEHGGAYPEWYYSPLAQITQANVHDLGPAWSFEFDTSRGQESTPIVTGGVMYVTTAWSRVFALDARTGHKLWSYDPRVPGAAAYKACCDVVNRGPAVRGGWVFVSTIDGRLIALDAKNGKPLWTAVTADSRRMSTITGAPRLTRDLVVIGNAGGEMGVRGYVSAYHIETGKLAWRFYTVPGRSTVRPDGAASDRALAEVARPTWFGAQTRAGGGGVVWNAMTYDPALDRIYLGTGNPYPWNRKFRSAGRGDNLFASSIVALDARTGRYIWHYQETPGDSWDFDACADIILADRQIDGRTRKVLMQASKNGFFYVLDRESGKLLSAKPFVSEVTWAKGVDLATGRPITASEAFYSKAPFAGKPGPHGAHNWAPTAYSPATGLVYIPASENSLRFVSSASYQFVEGVDDLGIEKGAAASPHAQNAGAADVLVAWDPVAERAAWRIPTRGDSGVLATAGGLVFQGNHRKGVAGELVAYAADTGRTLWRYKTPNAILAGSISYSLDGEQYVAVVGGAGGSDVVVAGGDEALEPGPGRVFVFKLGGKATLPADPPPAPPANPPAQTWPKAVVARGAATYGRLCSRCHGPDARSLNIIPDLRRSSVLGDAQGWKAVVIGGALQDAGMIGWGRFITPGDAESIRAFVAGQARALASRNR